MKISARIIADSLGVTRLTTFLVTMPRYLLAEWNTHCMLVRNAASSRAIPVAKRIQQVNDAPAGPVWWGANQAGMQASTTLNIDQTKEAKRIWLQAADDAVCQASFMAQAEVHKQFANRILEPYAWCSNLTTGTEWANFFNLRCSAEAQPEFDLLAGLMLREYVESIPTKLEPGEWHAPFGDRVEDLKEEDPDILKRCRLLVSAARCARLSYETHEGEFSVEKDIELAKRLIASGHMSPFGHQGRAMRTTGADMRNLNSHAWEYFLKSEGFRWDGKDLWSGQFRWWGQFRKLLNNENRTEMDPQQLLADWESRWTEREPNRERWDTRS